jgi:hypothetical protein
MRFRRHCLRNSPPEVEEAHLLEVPLWEASAESGGQVGGEALQQFLPVARSLASGLLAFHDPPADLPVCGGHDGVDRPGRRAARIFEQPHDFGQHRVVTGRSGASPLGEGLFWGPPVQALTIPIMRRSVSVMPSPTPLPAAPSHLPSARRASAAPSALFGSRSSTRRLRGPVVESDC